LLPIYTRPKIEVSQANHSFSQNPAIFYKNFFSHPLIPPTLFPTIMEYKQQVQVEQNSLQCQNNSEDIDMRQERRSANYKPNIWKYDFLQSLSSKYDVRS